MTAVWEGWKKSDESFRVTDSWMLFVMESSKAQHNLSIPLCQSGESFSLCSFQKVWQSAPLAHSALWSLFSLFHITCPHLSSHTTDCKQYPLYKLKECHTFCCHWSITFSTCYKVSHQACLLFLHKPASVSIHPVSLSCVQAQITWGWGVNTDGEDFYIYNVSLFQIWETWREAYLCLMMHYFHLLIYWRVQCNLIHKQNLKDASLDFF